MNMKPVGRLVQNRQFTYLPISKYLNIHLKYTSTAHQPQSSQNPKP